jgi:hypothetical protein
MIREQKWNDHGALLYKERRISVKMSKEFFGIRRPS